MIYVYMYTSLYATIYSLHYYLMATTAWNYLSQLEDNYISDIRWMWEDYVRQFIQSDKEDQELLEELQEYVSENGIEY